MSIEELNRADWEGMTNSLTFEKDERMTTFLNSIFDEFYRNSVHWGIRDATLSVISRMDQKQKDSLLAFMKLHFKFEGDLDLLGLQDYIKGAGGDVLKDNLKEQLGEMEWEKLEQEATRRILYHDITVEGTPG